MASISVRKDTNKLFFNFTYLNIRCREQTQFTDNKTNRKKLEKQLNKMEAEILTGAFSYGQYFPNSSTLEKIQVLENQNALSSTNVVNVFTPLFSKFVFEWVEENKLSWRKSHLMNITSIINKHYLPYFGDYEVG